MTTAGKLRAQTIVVLSLSGLLSCRVSPPDGEPPESTPGSGGATFNCESSAFNVTMSELSPQIQTVGIVEWWLTGGSATAATIVYTLMAPAADTENRGGRAPVDLTSTNYRTLLLGLKQGRDYTFHIEAELGGTVCQSDEYSLPTTGVLPNPPQISVEVALPQRKDPGFIVTSCGQPEPDRAYIFDADGDVVWAVEGPSDPPRARMDYEGKYMWMAALNLNNQGGEMRFVSMDGTEWQNNVAGLERTHHDFTVLPGGRVASISWLGDQPEDRSELVARSPDGSFESLFEIGGNLYKSFSYHANAVHYVPFDGGFTISDRNPNLIVKVSGSGEPQWQLGGNCADAPTGTRCSPQAWEVNHGHHLLEDGRFVLFNNTRTATSHVIEFQIDASDAALSTTLLQDFIGDSMTATLGDVQRLPSGNTLVTYSSASRIVELDPEWQVVQTFFAPIAYTNWRRTLYGPPERP